jgi:hypothetical protein
MEGIEKPHADKYKEITNDSNYGVGCTVTSLPVRDLKNFKHLVLVVQSVQEEIKWEKILNMLNVHVYFPFLLHSVIRNKSGNNFL